MRSRARVAAAAALAVALAGAPGCGRREAAAPAADGEPRAGGTAVVAFPSEPDVLNSLLAESAFTGQVLSLVQDTLLEMGEDLEWQPRIARDWSFGPDSLSVTFRLRPWVWEDGAPLTARDVASSFALFTSPVVASPRRGGFADVAAVAALDDRTVRYDLRRRLADPLFAAWHAILPAHLTDALDPAAVRSWPLNQRPLASGPFRLESWARNQALVLVRNERYPGPPARLDRLVFRIVPDETARLVELETGAVDVVDELPLEAAARLERGGAVVVHRVRGRLVGHLQWNLRNPLFADRRVRRALSLAIDRAAFVEGLLDGYAQPAASPIPPALWAHDAALAPDPFDPARARALLAEAGWRDTDGDGVLDRDGLRFSFTVVTRKGDPVRENGVVVIRENLRAVGVEVRPRVLEFGAALSEVRQGKFDAYLGVYQARLSVDPSALLRSTAVDRFNYGGYANATVDSLLDAGLACPDRAVAAGIWRRLQAAVAADAPCAFLYYPETLVGVSRRLRGVRPHLLSPYNNAAEWWLAETPAPPAPAPGTGGGDGE